MRSLLRGLHEVILGVHQAAVSAPRATIGDFHAELHVDVALGVAARKGAEFLVVGDLVAIDARV